MRRFAIFAAALFLLPGESAESQVRVTVTGGKNFSSLTERTREHTVRPWDFGEPWTWHAEAFGVALRFPVSDNWGIQVGGARSGKGYLTVASGIDLPFYELTVLSDRRIELGDRIRLHLLAGPFLGYMVDPATDQQPFDFGVAGGVQLDVGLYGKLGVVVGAIHAHGLVNTYYQHQTRTLTLRGGLSYSIG